MSILKWGVLATGNIARHFCADIYRSVGNKVVAVCSRQLSSAQTFAQQFAIDNSYDDFDRMLSEANLDVVYIATPHPFHFEATMQAFRAGIPVVCEKPLGMNYQQVSACIAEAKKQNTFLLEAVWMYFFPALAQTRHWIEAGKIGKPIMLDAGFHFATSQDPDSRLLNLNLGGGLC